MTLTQEELVKLREEIEDSNYLMAYKNRLRDLFDTIRARDEEVKVLQARIERVRALRDRFLAKMGNCAGYQSEFQKDSPEYEYHRGGGEAFKVCTDDLLPALEEKE